MTTVSPARVRATVPGTERAEHEQWPSSGATPSTNGVRTVGRRVVVVDLGVADAAGADLAAERDHRGVDDRGRVGEGADAVGQREEDRLVAGAAAACG